MGSARAEPLRIAFFTSPMARVILISRGQASVQLKMVRQRQTPSRSFSRSSRSPAPSFDSSDSRRIETVLPHAAWRTST